MESISAFDSNRSRSATERIPEPAPGSRMLREVRPSGIEKSPAIKTAVSLLVKNGYQVGIISGEKNSAIELIAETFKLKEVHQGIRNKIEVLRGILERNNLTPEEVLYVGDDV